MPRATPPKKQHDIAQFLRNLTNAAQLGQQVWQLALARQAADAPDMTADPLNISHAFSQMLAQMASDPQHLAKSQLKWWQSYVELCQSSVLKFWGVDQKKEEVVRDKRFKDVAWAENAVFDFLRQSYLLTSQWISQQTREVQGLSPQDAHKLEFYTRQFVDALSPSNFPLTNPEVLRESMESDGANLVRGMQHLLEDMQRGHGKLAISMTDRNAFELGRNLALTKGAVVYQNDLIQLIQYEALTEKVYETPLLIIPAWINKYYILDLQQENSLVRWLTEQGHTVFVVSWVNPDAKLGQKRFDDYMLQGPLAALEAIERITGQHEVSCMGYCLGGTLLAITLAWLERRKQATRVRNATYLTTMLDFSDAGDLAVFIDDAQLTQLEHKMAETGYLEGSEMAMTFNLLRANDLIWSFVVNNYLLGREPFPFDLLYWNSDPTRMPAAMHSYYLRNMYQRNKLIQPNGLEIADEPINLRTIRTPAYFLSTREDHIAPWKSTYVATQVFRGPVRFVLAASGHIAGVINPPVKQKYSYWTKAHEGKYPAKPDQWWEGAKETPGSWWPDWNQWQLQFAGKQIPARKLGSKSMPVIEPAPGSYVKVRAV